MIKKILFTVLIVLVQFVCFGQKTYNATSGSWSTPANWTPSGVPSATDDVIIPSGKTVTIDASVVAKSVTISGVLNMNVGSKLIVGSSTMLGVFTVNTTGSFSMPSTTSDHTATLLVYGPFYNYGTTSFGKADVVIGGDLISPSLSTLQNNGNVVVGGNLIGLFDTNGSGTGQIYVVNSNGTIDISSPKFTEGVNIVAGTPVPSTDPTLLGLADLVIYGGTCSGTVTAPSNISACSGSTTLTALTNFGSGYTCQWQVYNGSDWSNLENGANYSGVTTLSLTINNISGAMKNYRYRLAVTLSTCTKYGNFTTFKNTTWNGTSWNNGTPTSASNIVFTGSYPATDVDLTGCTCQVTGGANVTIKSGRTLKVANEVTVLGNGTLTFENNASLVQINDAAENLGNIIYKRNTPLLIETDYTYWSSPVTGQSLNISPDYTSGMCYSFDPTADDWAGESMGTTMTEGKGYIMRGQKSDDTPYTITATFTGVPNNGQIQPSISADKSCLLGNPYPSALDADTFLTANAGVLDGTLYFWTHNTAIQLASNITNGSAGSGMYAYTSDDYASYNRTGGVGTSGNTIAGEKASDPRIEVTANRPSGKIAAGQGFFATGIATGTVMFNNSMRVGVGTIAGNNSQFFRPGTRPVAPKGIEKHRIWLNLSNDQGAFKQTLVGYVTDAANGYDGAFDGESFDGNEYVDFYSVNEDKNLVIQGRALPFKEKDSVALGYKTTIEGAFKISIDQVDGKLASQKVFIEDKLLHSIHDLKQGSYVFTTEIGTFNDRFVLRYVNKTNDGFDVEVGDDKVSVFSKNKRVTINSTEEVVNKVLIYDLLGRKLYEKNNVNSHEVVISNLISNPQVLLVKTILQNGQTVTKKILY